MSKCPYERESTQKGSTKRIPFIMVEVTQLFAKYQCTFAEEREILKTLLAEIKAQQEHREYATLDDYFDKKKSANVENEAVWPLNHVDEWKM